MNSKLKLANELDVEQAKQSLLELEQHCARVEKVLHLIKDVDNNSWQAYMAIQSATSLVSNARNSVNSMCYIDWNDRIHIGKVVKEYKGKAGSSEVSGDNNSGVGQAGTASVQAATVEGERKDNN